MPDDLLVFRSALQSGGLLAGIRVLSARTSFRFTGVYRFERLPGSEFKLKNVVLVDRHDPSVSEGPSVPLADAYCDYFGAHGEAFEFADINDPQTLVPRKARNPALSYCGVVIRDARGQAVGSLCYFDTRPCQPRTTDLPLLQEAAKLMAPHLS